MVIKTIVAVSALVFLAGCGPSRQEMMTRASDECFAYGADHGTPAFTQCMMMKDQQYANDQMQRRAAVQGALSNMQSSINANTPVTMAPRTCTSNRIGNQVVTNCQ